MNKSEFGVIGLGVMGKSISLNIAEKGFSISVYNRISDGEESIVSDFLSDNNFFKNITGFANLESFVASVERPRKILIMIKSGLAVDSIIEQLIPNLSEGDIIIDGGNSHFNDTQKIFENGLAEEEEVEQLNITLLGLQTNLNNAIRMEAIAYDMLKVTMGIPVEQPIMVTDNLNDLSVDNFDLLLLSKEIAVENNIDYRLAEDQANQAESLVKLEKTKALPSLSAFVNYGAQGNSDTFSFFNSSQVYYDQSVLGLSLNVPLFSSGMRSAKTAQKKIQYEQALLQLEQTKNQVELEISSARNDYKFSLENYENTKKSLALAERIENKNQIKFFEGLASSFDLSEARQQLYQAQQNYLQAMLEIITKKSDLENLLDTTQYTKQN